MERIAAMGDDEGTVSSRTQPFQKSISSHGTVPPSWPRGYNARVRRGRYREKPNKTSVFRQNRLRFLDNVDDTHQLKNFDVQSDPVQGYMLRGTRGSLAPSSSKQIEAGGS
jgi:hypothetical protein